MRKLVSTMVLVSTALVGVQGCADQPTTPQMVSSGEATLAKGGNRPRAKASQTIDAPLMTAAGEAVGRLQGTVYLTRVDLAEDGSLVGTARIIGTATTAAGSVPVDITTTAPLSMNGRSGVGGAGSALMSAQDVGTQAVGSCDIVNLVLGPLHLDILGLVVDLNQVVLDVVAQTGAGNLLGNLLCAVVSLLDGIAIGPLLTQLLERLNDILAIF
jgi:hypothetical protein